MSPRRILRHVEAPPETVWALLLDKVEHPQRYLEGVLDARILDEGEDWALRELELPGLQLRERVRMDEGAGTVSFTLLDHPCCEGEILNRMHPQADGTVDLEFLIDWRPRPGAESGSFDPEPLILSALEHIKEIAEELARQTTS